jgi:hypothetical protein
MIPRTSIFPVLSLLLLALRLPAGAATSEPGTALTIYSTARPGAVSADLYRPLPDGSGRMGRVPGYAVVREERTFELTRGRSELRFVDVAALIDPTTVRFESLTDPDGTRVLEQNFQFDLVSQEKLLERFLDRRVRVEQLVGDRIEVAEGTLLSAAGGLILADESGRIRTLRSWSGIEFPELPGGLITRPTLVWDLVAERGGDHRTRVSYQTEGMTWWADYNLVFTPGSDANSGLLDVGAWVSIVNQSGSGYENARLKLIAGDVQRAAAQGYGAVDQLKSRTVAFAEANAGFEEKSFFEYHLYTLGRPTTLPDRSTKQLELFDAARGVPADKLLVYQGQAGRWGIPGSPMTDRNFGAQSNPKVDVYLVFRNEEEHGLGVPLPAGRIRVSQLDEADDSLEFIGEDVIDHTPRDEDVRVRLGSAFDVVGERKQVEFRVDSARRTMEETIEIELRNHKDEAVDVLVEERLFRWTNWELLESSHDYRREDAHTVHFPLRVPADGEQKLRYSVRYSW